jgi:predicted dehydrogenase
MDKFRWAYIGCGSIANKTAKIIVGSGLHEIVAVWNRTRSRAISFSKWFGGKIYDSPEEAIADKDVQGVYISVSHDKHAEYVQLCIKNHKPVLCEKPITISAKEAEQVFELAAKEKIYLAEAMWTWFNQTAITVKKWVDSGEIGEVISVEASFAYPIIQLTKFFGINSFRLTNPAQAGGVLLDMGIYPLRYCLGLFGMPKTILCEGKVEGGVDLDETVKLGYSGFDCNIHNSLIKFKVQKFTINGSRGTITIPGYFAGTKAVLRQGARKVVFRDQVRSTSGLYLCQFDTVAEEIMAGKLESEKVSVSSSIDTMKILDECRRQMGLVYPFEK